MIKNLIIFIIGINAFAQDVDSLFWFDAKNLNEDLPKFPLVLNKVLLGEYMPPADLKSEAGQTAKEVFRIQIFESSVASIARSEAKRFQNILGDTVYTVSPKIF